MVYLKEIYYFFTPFSMLDLLFHRGQGFADFILYILVQLCSLLSHTASMLS